MQTVLLTGGAGYIGSHTCLVLLENNFRVVVYDSFINSSKLAIQRVRKIIEKKVCDLDRKLFIWQGDIRDEESLKNAFRYFNQRKIPIKAVIHFAGLKAVSDSFFKSKEYWDVNVNGSKTLLKVMDLYGCSKIVFSSSAAVYDSSSNAILKENNKLRPTSPYGETKLEVEKILECYFQKQKNWANVILRYFNPIGAHSSGLIGEDPKTKPTNLIPLLTEACANFNTFEIYGNDWPTNDGTCIRDFIHVMDLAEAHLQSLLHIQNEKSKNLVLNVGTGKGTTVLQLIKVFEVINKCKIKYKFSKRREGDISQSIADNSLILSTLNWKNKKDIKDMCKDSWKWKKMNPKGYKH